MATTKKTEGYSRIFEGDPAGIEFLHEVKKKVTIVFDEDGNPVGEYTSYPTPKLTTLQIGACGVLLLQYHLLRMGIESSPMTTDSGIDLVAYSPIQKKALTIQVKTNLRPKPGGGKGKLALDWWVRKSSPAELVALVDLESEGIWLFTHQELLKLAQQQPEGRLHFYFYVKGQRDLKIKKGNLSREEDYVKYQLENRCAELFGLH